MTEKKKAFPDEGKKGYKSSEKTKKLSPSTPQLNNDPNKYFIRYINEVSASWKRSKKDWSFSRLYRKHNGVNKMSNSFEPFTNLTFLNFW